MPNTTKDMATPFVRPEIPEINTGHVSLQYKVRGYWASPVSIDFSRELVHDSFVWTTDIKNASGGVENAMWNDCRERVRNLAMALLDAAAFVESSDVDFGLEPGYQAWLKKLEGQ